MRPQRPRFLLRTQRGFAIVAAIFLLVLLSALGAFMLTMSNTQHLTSAQDIQGTRAYWAAKGGMQWAVASIGAAAACPLPANSSFGLDGYAVTVVCQSVVYIEGEDDPSTLLQNESSKTIYWVVSTATSGGAVGSIGYTERAINAFVEF